MADVTVNLTGPVLAMLLYENENSSGDQEGILFGNVSEDRTKVVTDAEMERVTIKKKINVAGLFALHEDVFYNNIGIVDTSKFNKLFDKPNNIIGWFRFRRNSNIKPTLREKLIHKNLCQLTNVPAELFTLCILTNFTTKNNTTHHFSHTFYRYNTIEFMETPMHIENLGDSRNIYRTKLNSKNSFDKFIKTLNININKTSNISIVNKIQTGVQQQLAKLVEQVAETSKELFNLENEVKQLQNFSNSVPNQTESDEILKIDNETSDDSPDISISGTKLGAKAKMRLDSKKNNKPTPMSAENCKKQDKSIRKSKRSTSTPNPGGIRNRQKKNSIKDGGDSIQNIEN